MSADYVRSHLSFDWQVYKVVNPQEMHNLTPVVTEGLEQAVERPGHDAGLAKSPKRR